MCLNNAGFKQFMYYNGIKHLTILNKLDDKTFFYVLIRNNRKLGTTILQLYVVFKF
jgi:hypothetical protein